MKESLKPIEPGCLAILINILYNKDTVREFQVVKVIDRTPPHILKRYYACDLCKRFSSWDVDYGAKPVGMACECSLIRIDPDDDIKNEEIEDESDISNGTSNPIRERTKEFS